MSIVDKMKEMLGQHSDKAQKGVEKAGDMVDKKTGSKHAKHVDMAQQRAREALDKNQAERAKRTR